MKINHWVEKKYVPVEKITGDFLGLNQHEKVVKMKITVE